MPARISALCLISILALVNTDLALEESSRGEISAMRMEASPRMLSPQSLFLREYYWRVMYWQSREDPNDVPFAMSSPSGVLLDEYVALENAAERMSELPVLVAVLNGFMLGVSKRRYRHDSPADKWPTTAELFNPLLDGEDCDGLELLTYHYLRRVRGEVGTYRGVFVNRADSTAHMATVVFNASTSRNPYVVDSTGALGARGIKLSDLGEGWELEFFFDEKNVYTLDPFIGEGGK